MNLRDLEKRYGFLNIFHMKSIYEMYGSCHVSDLLICISIIFFSKIKEDYDSSLQNFQEYIRSMIESKLSEPTKVRSALSCDVYKLFHRKQFLCHFCIVVQVIDSLQRRTKILEAENNILTVKLEQLKTKNNEVIDSLEERNTILEAVKNESEILKVELEQLKTKNNEVIDSLEERTNILEAVKNENEILKEELEQLKTRGNVTQVLDSSNAANEVYTFSTYP